MSPAGITLAACAGWLALAAAVALGLGRAVALRDRPAPRWVCGAFAGADGYRCTLDAGHLADEHEAWLDGVRVAVWPRGVDAL